MVEKLGVHDITTEHDAIRFSRAEVVASSSAKGHGNERPQLTITGTERGHQDSVPVGHNLISQLVEVGTTLPVEA